MLMRWETETRYYVVHVQTDLFGALTLRRVWGGRNAVRGGERLECVDQATLERRMRAIAAVRQRNGYVLTIKR